MVSMIVFGLVSAIRMCDLFIRMTFSKMIAKVITHIIDCWLDCGRFHFLILVVVQIAVVVGGNISPMQTELCDL